MSKTKPRVGIIGLGYVGGAALYWFKGRGRRLADLYLYDKYKNIGSVEEVNKADIVFVCVPTPYREDGRGSTGSLQRGYDDSAIIESLKNLKTPKAVVIKSTVLPGSTERFQKRFPKHFILFSPEFLVAKTANNDFVNPKRQIVGYTAKSKKYARTAMDILPKAPFSKIMPATEAELVKYFGNTFLATRVVFANQIYDLCTKLGVDYDLVKESAGMDHRVGHSHFDIFSDGYRGYGGACLPKDTRAFIDFAKSQGVNFELLQTVERLNNILRKNSGETAI